MHRIVGLDISGDAVRVVALESGFRGFAVQGARTAELAPPSEGTAAERLTRALQQIALEPPLGTEDTVAVSLPGAQVASHLLTLPFADARRIEQVLPAEIEGAIPFDLDDVVWDYAVLSQAPGKTEVLVAIVRKTALREHLDALSAAGIEPRVVSFAPLALLALGERGLIADAGASPEGVLPPGALALLDAGPDRADLAVLDGSSPVLARSLATSGAPAWEAAKVDDAAREKLLGPVIRDLKITLRSRRLVPRKLLLAGRIASLPGAVEHIAAELQLPVEPLDLGGAAAALPSSAEVGKPEVALALGLALRAQQPRGRINFRKGEFAFVKDLSEVRGQLSRMGAAAALLFALAVGLGVARMVSLSHQARDYDDALCAATKRILGTCLTDYRQAVSQLQGGKSKAGGIPRVSSAEILAELTAHMPEDAPLLEDVEVTTTSVRVKGTAESFGKIDEIISSLKKDKCFGEIKQPRTEKARDGSKVTFSMDFPYTCSGETPGGA